MRLGLGSYLDQIENERYFTPKVDKGYYVTRRENYL